MSVQIGFTVGILKSLLLIRHISFQVADERKRKELKRINQFGRKGFYNLPDGSAILRGYLILNCDVNDNSDMTNAIVAVVMHHINTVDNWRSFDLDVIIDIGNQLFIDSYIAYGPKDKKLGLENIMRKFFMNNLSIHITIYKPVVNEMFIISKINDILQVYFQQETYCILSYMNQWVSIFFKGGLFYLFDSHGGNLEGERVKHGEPGSAFLMKFNDLEKLAAQLFHNLFIPEQSSAKMFSLWLIDVEVKN